MGHSTALPLPADLVSAFTAGLQKCYTWTHCQPGGLRLDGRVEHFSAANHNILISWVIRQQFAWPCKRLCDSLLEAEPPDELEEQVSIS